MAPLVAAMDHPRPLNQVRVGIMDDAHVNAASGGGGEFYVTTGLLQKANDDQLRGVLAHELAHDDLGHVAKAQSLGARLGIGMIILGTQERVDALNQLQPEVYELVEPENRCPEAFKEQPFELHGLDRIFDTRISEGLALGRTSRKTTP